MEDKFTVTNQLSRFRNHSILLIIAIVLNIVAFIYTLFYSFNKDHSSFFNSTIANFSKKYSIEINPASWTFATW
jgi:flagellar basal body-associated protein FliL